jgi:hypothetical protein
MKMEDIIVRLLGDISVYCDTFHDDEVMKNLDGYSEALSAILKRMFGCASWKGDYRGSANACGEKAQRLVIDCIMESIDDKTASELLKAIKEAYPQNAKEEEK